MKLYIDITKALAQVPAVSTGPETGPQAKRDYDESFNKESAGVLGGDPTKDSGNHKDTGSLDEELEEQRKLDSQISQERGLTPKPEAKKPETKKSQEVVDFLKSFSSNIKEQLRVVLPNEREIEYLTTVRGYSTEDINKGLVGIRGHERSRFNSWLQQRLMTNIERLQK